MTPVIVNMRLARIENGGPVIKTNPTFHRLRRAIFSGALVNLDDCTIDHHHTEFLFDFKVFNLCVETSQRLHNFPQSLGQTCRLQIRRFIKFQRSRNDIRGDHQSFHNLVGAARVDVHCALDNWGTDRSARYVGPALMKKK